MQFGLHPPRKGRGTLLQTKPQQSHLPGTPCQLEPVKRGCTRTIVGCQEVVGDMLGCRFLPISIGENRSTKWTA
eukprot:3797680-Lingulodinium_polyedra.AAC.1